MCSSQARNKLSDQIFVNKENKTPQLIKFHPYISQLAVMQKNSWRYVERPHLMVHVSDLKISSLTLKPFYTMNNVLFIISPLPCLSSVCGT